MCIIEWDLSRLKSIINNGMLVSTVSVQHFNCINCICTTFEHIDLPRCFNCAGCHHMANNCSTKGNTCVKCWHNRHTTVNYKEQWTRCPNFAESNGKCGLNFNTDHTLYEMWITQKENSTRRNKIDCTGN